MRRLMKALEIGGFILISLLPMKTRSQSINNPDSTNSDYSTALSYEQDFLSNRSDTTKALMAIDYFEKYYNSTPHPKNPCNAMIRKARLLHEIGKDSDSQSELNKIKELGCWGIYSNLIKYMEGKLNKNGRISRSN